MASLALHALALLAAALLFQIELIAAKRLLPAYGGSHFVWGACLVFFQALLLAGYAAVHGAFRALGAARARWLLVAVVLLPFLGFPGRALVLGGQAGEGFVAGRVFLDLLLGLGPAFLALSTVGVGVQAWLSASTLPQRANPYPVYATSNLGSLAALVSYPVLVEPWLSLSSQLVAWRVGYALMAALLLGLVLRVPLATESADVPEQQPGPRPRPWLWLLYGAAPVVLYMAVTTVITSSIVPVPLFWVVPLALYLAAFVLSFQARPWRPAWLSRAAPWLTALSALLFLAIDRRNFAASIQLVATCLVVFLLALLCHGRLAALRPAAGRELTRFYLLVSLGGFAGGLATSWLVPLLSKSVVEYPLALTLVAAGLWLEGRGKAGRLRTAALLVAPAMLLWSWLPELVGVGDQPAFKQRNAYGIYEVEDSADVRLLHHGTTVHGAQLRVPGLELEPSGYYSLTSPVGELLSSTDAAFPSVGVVGLGAGTLAAYARRGQSMEFFELDPDMHALARRWFTFLEQAVGDVRVVHGDGRRALELLPDRRYDLLVLDAFGGDAIPAHLITREALALYRARLAAGGVLLVHVTNRFLEVDRVLAAGAAEAGTQALHRSTDGRPAGLPSHWVALTWDPARDAWLRRTGWSPADARGLRPWTDDDSSVLPILTWGGLWGALVALEPFGQGR